MYYVTWAYVVGKERGHVYYSSYSEVNESTCEFAIFVLLAAPK